jgi:WXXGXW repeat (2 copies)
MNPLKLAVPVLASLLAVASIGCVVHEREVVAANDPNAAAASAEPAEQGEDEAEAGTETAPPADQVDDPGPPPSPEHVWVTGHWHWEGGRWAWIHGHWAGHRVGFAWVPGHWQPHHHKHVFVWVRGHWARR